MNGDKLLRLAQAGVLVSALLGFAVAQGAVAAETIAAGSGSFQFADALGNRDKPITVWTHAPRRLRATSPLVFVMHGVRRNGRDYRDQWVEHAEKHGFLLIVPEFSEQYYSSDAYQLGNLRDGAGQPVDPSLWTYTAIEHLFDHVQKMTGNKTPRYFLYGHSAGGQFVHRLALFLPEARYQRAVAANPGWYTMPDAEIAFPYGLGGTTADASKLKQSFANRFVLLLGSEDTNRDDPNLRKTPQADAQGLTRFERGKNYFQAARQRAKDLETEFAWKQQVVRGAGHSDKQMSKAAVTVFSAR
jgi:poly(3-hydroxybutyrate) depolymerase